MSTVLPVLAVQAREALASPQNGRPASPSHADEPTPLDKPTPPPSIKKEALPQASAPEEPPNFLVPGPKVDFWILPIPTWCRWRPDEGRPEFTLLLNAVFGLASTFCVASLYYTLVARCSVSMFLRTLY